MFFIRCTAARSRSPGGLGNRSGASRCVLLFKFFAPAFDFGVVKNLAYDAAEESFEVGVFHIAQRANGFLFVSFKETAGAFVGLEFGVERFDGVAVRSQQRGAPPA